MAPRMKITERQSGDVTILDLHGRLVLDDGDTSCVERIDALIRRIAPPHARPALEIDPTAGTVLVRGRRHELSKMELKLLQYFVDHQGDVLTREQLLEIERLRQIIIGASVKPSDPVLDCIARREHQDRHGGASRAQLLANLDPILARQHNVQNDQVIVVEISLRQGLLAIHHDVNGVSFFAQAFGQHPDRIRLVFDQQNARHVGHAGSTIVNVLPVPSLDSTAIRPPCA